MSESINKSSLIVIFYRFKESHYYSFTLFLFVFLVAIFLLVFAIVPQVQSLFTLNTGIEATQKNVKILKKNIEYLSSLSDSNLQEDLQVTFSALPSEKDFVGIVNAVNGSAATSGVSLDNYTLAIGELATPSAGLESFFPLSVDVNVHGSAESITKFLTTTQTDLPISEIDSIDYTLGSKGIDADIKIIFFFKVYKNENYSVATPIASISPQGIVAIKTVKEWRSNIVSDGGDIGSTVSGGLEDPF